MTNKFSIHECGDPQCRLRFPINPLSHSGAFCPKCGASTQFVARVDHTPDSKPGPTPTPRHFSALLDNFRSSLNTGSAFRTANGAGFSHLFLCGITPQPADNTKIGKTALGAENMVPWSYHPNAVSLAKELKAKGTILLALEFTPAATNLFDYEYSFPGSTPVALIAGGELAGVDPGLLDLADAVLYIPMRGDKGSLNVAVAFGIAAYHLTSQG